MDSITQLLDTQASLSNLAEVLKEHSKMHYKTRYSTIALTVLLSTLLVACGSDSDDPVDVVNPDPDTPMTPVDPGPDVPPVVVEPQPERVTQRFTNQQLWLDALTGMANQIDFESVAVAGRTQAISGDEFVGFPGSPRLAISNNRGSGIEIGDPGGDEQIIPPTSGVNSIFMACDSICEGVVEVSFSEPMIAFGAFFVDVEADFATTGFTLSETAAVPEFAFTEPQGQSSQSFLGFTNATPFTSVFIHFSTGPTNDGTAMDDMVYVFDVEPVTTPTVN